MTLVMEIYMLTKSFPGEEKFGMISQLRRCAVSIPSNIAEGSGRKSNKEFSQFLNISYGSLCELDTQLIISKNLGYINESDFEEFIVKIDELQKMTFALINKL